MRKPNSDELSLVTIGMTQTLALWTVLAPNVHDVRAADPVTSKSTVSALHTAEFVVGGIATTIAIISAVYTKSPVPLVVTGVTVLSLIAAYELTLRNTTIGEGNNV